MAVSKLQKIDLIKKFGGDEKNTGSTEAQIAILTAEISNLTEHVKTNKKDFSGKRGLYQMVSKRRSLLKYLEKNDIEKYRNLVKELNLRS